MLSARATPGALGPAGGQVPVTGTVENAATCQLELLSRQSFPVVYSHNPTTACQDGSFSAHVTIGANPSPVKRTVAFALVARNGAYSSTGRFYVSLEPVSVPEVLSARATPSALGPAAARCRDRDRQERRHLPARAAVAPVLPRRVLAQPDNGLPRRQLLGPRHHRGQPERHGKRTRRLRPGRPQRELLVHRALLRLARAVVGARASCPPAPPRAPSGRAGGNVRVSGTVKNARYLPARAAVAPVLPCRLLAQPDQRLPQTAATRPT